MENYLSFLHQCLFKKQAQGFSSSFRSILVQFSGKCPFFIGFLANFLRDSTATKNYIFPLTELIFQLTLEYRFREAKNSPRAFDFTRYVSWFTKLDFECAFMISTFLKPCSDKSILDLFGFKRLHVEICWQMTVHSSCFDQKLTMFSNLPCVWSSVLGQKKSFNL